MFRKVDTQPNFVQREHEILDFWSEIQAFDTLRKINAGKPPWSFLDGPITANNPMGVHHAWGRTYKDAFGRYFAMNRRELRHQNGFDCQGLWVELEVEKQLQLRKKSDIEAYGLDRFTEACKERVRKYSTIQAEQSKRLGYWMDWDDSYFTFSEENNYCIWGFIKACHERGFLYKGTDVMPWSGPAGSAYSDMEVKEGRRLTTHTAVFVRLPLRGRDDEYLLVWTTTPWTLSSNVGVAVNGDLDYVKLRAKKDGALYYLAKDNLEFKRMDKEFKEGFPPYGKWPKGAPKLKTVAQIFKEQGGYDIEGTVKGSELVGLSYDGPFDELPAQRRTGGFAENLDLIPLGQRAWPAAKEAHRVFDPGKDGKGSPYVVAGEGTGMVHSAPGCGDIDHIWGQEHQLVAIAPLNAEGKFIEGFGPLTDRDPTDPETVELILNDLRNKGLLVAAEQYPHIYPHCWRSGNELIYRLVDEWYISMDWREDIKDTTRMVNWIPAQMRGRERELDWLTTMKDWMISKKRYWGLALPIWECEQCSKVTVIGSREELQERAISGWETFDREGHSPHRPYVDAIQIECDSCGATVSRIPDVGNPWLDAGIVAYSTTKYRSDPEYWKTWVPADLVLECFPGQFRNWFYSLLSMSTMMERVRADEAAARGDAFEKRPPFKNLLGHALVMNEHRQAMHKSDGTAIWFEEAAEQIGVDTMRWMYCAQSPILDLPFGLRHPDQEVDVEVAPGKVVTHTVDGVRMCKVTSAPADEVRRRVLLTLWNSYAFFCNYARLDGFDPQATAIEPGDRPDIDRWILSDLQLTVAHCRENFEKFLLAPVCERLEQFIDALSNWYIRRNRRRFWRSGQAQGADADKRAAYQTLYDALETLARLAAPIIPFLAEDMWRNFRGANPSLPASVHHSEYPRPKVELVDEDLSAAMNATIKLVSMGRAVRSQHNIGVRQPLAKIIVIPRDEAETKAVARFEAQILEELNIKVLEVSRDAQFLSWTVKPDFKRLGKRLGKKMKLLAQRLPQLPPEALLDPIRRGETVDVDLEGEAVTLEPEDLIVRPEVPEGLALIEDGGSVVLLDTKLDDALVAEGLAREFVRRIADLRKARDYEMDDRINVRIGKCDADLRDALQAHREFIAHELLADRFEFDDAVEAEEMLIRADPRSAGVVDVQKAPSPRGVG